MPVPSTVFYYLELSIFETKMHPKSGKQEKGGGISSLRTSVGCREILMNDMQDEANKNSKKAVPVHFVQRDELSRDEQVWTDKGNAAAEKGDYEVAAQAFARAVELSPNNARARYNLALAQQYLNDPEMAIAGYRRAIDLDPQLIDAYINLGNLYREIGLLEEALETFQQALELDSESDELYVNVGDAYRALNLYQDAIQAYRQARMLNPDHTLAASSLVDAREWINEQWRRVLEQEKQIDESPSDPSRYAELASLYLDMRRYDDALAAANAMLSLDPDGRTGYDMLVVIYEQMGDRDQASEMYARIVEIDAGDVEAWEHLGNWRSLQGKHTEAIDAYVHSLSLDPQRYTVSFGLAETYLEVERYDEALGVYQELVEDAENGRLQSDDLAAAYAGLAETYNALGRYNEAIQAAESLLEHSEDDPEGFYQLAIAYEALGRRDEAIENYQNAIESDPLNADYYNDFADTLRKAKRYAEALDVAQQGIAMDPSMIVAYETMARIYEETGRTDDAAAAMSQANMLRSVSSL